MRWKVPPTESLRDVVIGFSVACVSYLLWGWRTAACVSGSPVLAGILTSIEGALDTWVLWRIAVKQRWAFAVGCVVGMGVGAGLATAWKWS